MSITDKKQKEKLNLFFLLQYLLCAIIVWSTVQREFSVASATFTFSFLTVAFWFVKMVLIDRCTRYMTGVFLTVVLSTVFVVVSAMLEEKTVTMDYLTNHLCFLATIMFLFVIMNSTPNGRTGRIILVFNVFFGYVYYVAYRLVPQEDTMKMLTLNFSNPNLTGMWILQSVLYALVAMAVLKSVFFKVLAAVSVPLNVWLILQTEARNCILTLVLFAVLYLWTVFKQRPRFSKGLIMGVNLIPIAFVPVYLTYVKTIINKGWFSFLTDEGKSLDSRVWVWQERLDHIQGVWLIGNYTEGGGNAHNSHMVLLASYGVVGLVLGIWLLYTVCTGVNGELHSRKNLFALLAFFGVIFMGIGEGALFSGAMGLFVLACGFLYVARCDFDTEEKSLLRQ